MDINTLTTDIDKKIAALEREMGAMPGIGHNTDPEGQSPEASPVSVPTESSNVEDAEFKETY